MITIEYIVYHADFALKRTGEFFIDDWGYNTERIEPSDKIDERTVRNKVFENEYEATKYANEILKRRKDDKWLAKVRITRRTSEVIF